VNYLKGSFGSDDWARKPSSITLSISSSHSHGTPLDYVEFSGKGEFCSRAPRSGSIGVYSACPLKAIPFAAA
jgi:hypothetical protein